MIPNLDRALLDGFVAWTRSAESESEQEARTEELYALVFDDVDDEAERARVEKLWRAATSRDSGSTNVLASLATAVPAVPTTTTLPPRVRRRPSEIKLYDPRRSGYMRSSREEGLGADLRRAHDESRGSPLYGNNSDALMSDAMDRVRKLMRIPSGKK